MLTPSMAATFWVVRRWPYRVRARSVTLAGLAARVLWFDEQVANALDAGIGQIAVIGAGYDSRAWRFRRDGVQSVSTSRTRKRWLSYWVTTER